MTLSELHDEIGHAEYVFRSEMDHLPEVLLLGRKEFELLVSIVYTGGFYFYSINIESILKYKQFDVYEVNVPSLIRVC